MTDDTLAEATRLARRKAQEQAQRGDPSLWLDAETGLWFRLSQNINDYIYVSYAYGPNAALWQGADGFILRRKKRAHQRYLTWLEEQGGVTDMSRRLRYIRD